MHVCCPELFEDRDWSLSLSIHPLYLTQRLVHVNVGGMEMKGKAVMFFGTISNTSLMHGSMIIGTDFSSSKTVVS